MNFVMLYLLLERAQNDQISMVKSQNMILRSIF